MLQKNIKIYKKSMKPFTVQFESLRADKLHVSFQLQENNSDANDYLSKRKTFADLGQMQTQCLHFF